MKIFFKDVTFQCHLNKMREKRELFLARSLSLSCDTYPVIISKPIISGSHSTASFSPLDTELSANDDEPAAADDGKLFDGALNALADAAELTGFSVAAKACADGCSSKFIDCGASSDEANAILSFGGASAAFAMGKSIFDFLRTPFVSELDSKTIKSKFTAFGHMLCVK